MNALAFSAAKILAIPVGEPERLFSSAAEAKAEFRKLAMAWHPDKNKTVEAGDVFPHLDKLYNEAEKKIAAGVWSTPGWLELKKIDSSTTIRIRYRAKHEFELGEMFYGDKVIAWVLRQEFADLFENAKRTISRLQYRDDTMKKEFARYMPEVLSTFETDDNHFVMVVKKTPDVFLLRDILNHFGGKLDPRHAAWILNSIYNQTCYLDYSKLSHNGISADTCFVSPQFHSSMMLGGWWYAVPQGAKMNALPLAYHRYGPPDIIRGKTGDIRLDLSMVRVLGRELLGDITGMAMDAGIPEPIRKYLRQPAGINAPGDYSSWGTALHTSYGKRRFVKLDVSASDIYKD